MSKAPNLITKFTLILFGVFVTSLIYAFAIKIFDLNGLLAGTIANLALSGAGLYHGKKSSYIQIASWTILVSTVIGVLVYLFGVQYVSNSIEL